MYVCMSVRNRFTIGIFLVYAYFWHVPLRMPSRDGMKIEVEESEDGRKRQNKSRCMEDG